MGERKGTKGLELWCKRMTEGYPGVKIDNMTTSWRDGLAFCAIIHHFRPELIDFKKLKKEDVYANNELAFRVAEQYLGIPALLEAEDMVEYAVPDRLSILTYLSQFYQAFAVTQGSPLRIVQKRPSSSTGIVSPASTSPPNKKMPIPGVDILRLKPCAKCLLPVFFAERLNVGKLLYHRTCFRCARCNNQLTLANCYETETTNQYCCETCPDEEPTEPSSPDNATGMSILSRSLSDEEKTAGLNSYMFETANSEVIQPSSVGIARKSFLQMNMLPGSGSDDEEAVKVPDPPRSARPSVVGLSAISISEHQSDIINSNSDSGRPDSSSVSSSRDIKVQIDTTEDSSSIVKARMRLFEKKCDPQPTFTTKVTENDLSTVTEPKVPIANDDLDKLNVKEEECVIDDTSVNIADQSDSISLDFKEAVAIEESQENVQIDSTIESVITVSDQTISSSDDVICISDYKTTCEDSVVTISDESDILNEPKQESNFGGDKDSTADLLDSKIQYKTSCEISLSEPQSNISSDIERSEESVYKEHHSLPEDDSLSKTEYKTTCEDSVIFVREETNDTFLSQEPSVNTQSDESTDMAKVEDISLLKETKETAQMDEIEKETTNNVELDSGLQSMQPSLAEELKGSPAGESYPGELNPFSDDEEHEDERDNKRSSTNPFDEDEDDEEPSTPPRRLIKLNDEDKVTFTPGPFQISRISEVYPPSSTAEFKKPIPITRKKVSAPKISLTPFWVHEDEDFTTESKMSRNSVEHPQPLPRISDVSSSITSPYGSSTTSLSSITTTSSVQSGKRKKAPAPPKPRESTQESTQESEPNSSLTSSPSTSVQHSPRSTPRPRKSMKAPAPPTSMASTPSGLTVPHPKISISPIQFDNTKIAKDEVNRNRKSQTFSEPTSPTATNTPDKSTYGKWKRKKNLAPEKPVAIRRTIKELPMVEVKRELDIIEVQQQGLERQGVKLEHIIRMRCESADSELNEDNIPIEVEDMILQLFEVVNEKNELCRRQAELMYLKKQHRLEEEHAEVEYQIRCLMLTPDKNKTDTDKSKEEELIKRLIEIVEKKNEIIECLDMDRVREHEEDHSFTSSMNSYANKRDAGPTTLSNDDSQSLSKKEKKKLKKKFKLKIGGSHHQQVVDADKDIDETEVNQVKEKKKKKFAIF